MPKGSHFFGGGVQLLSSPGLLRRHCPDEDWHISRDVIPAGEKMAPQGFKYDKET